MPHARRRPSSIDVQVGDRETSAPAMSADRGPRIEREVLSISRLAEFCSKRELVASTGRGSRAPLDSVHFYSTEVNA
jgi:hypothetical protein